MVNTCCDAIYVLAGKEGISPTNVEIDFESSLAWEGLGQHKLRYIWCPRCRGMDMVNIC